MKFFSLIYSLFILVLCSSCLQNKSLERPQMREPSTRDYGYEKPPRRQIRDYESDPYTLNPRSRSNPTTTTTTTHGPQSSPGAHNGGHSVASSGAGTQQMIPQIESIISNAISFKSTQNLNLDLSEEEIIEILKLKYPNLENNPETFNLPNEWQCINGKKTKYNMGISKKNLSETISKILKGIQSGDLEAALGDQITRSDGSHNYIKFFNPKNELLTYNFTTFKALWVVLATQAEKQGIDILTTFKPSLEKLEETYNREEMQHSKSILAADCKGRPGLMPHFIADRCSILNQIKNQDYCQEENFKPEFSFNINPTLPTLPTLPTHPPSPPSLAEQVAVPADNPTPQPENTPQLTQRSEDEPPAPIASEALVEETATCESEGAQEILDPQTTTQINQITSALNP